MGKNRLPELPDRSILPRDAMRKRGLCCRPVSVRLSVTLVYCIQTAEDIIKLFSRPGSPINLVFQSRVPMPNSKGKHFSEDAKYRGGKILRFSTEITVYLGNGTR